MTDANLYAGDRLLLTLSAAGLRNLDTPYSRLWITPQASVERPLIERLQELGGMVERSRELEGFRQTNQADRHGQTRRCLREGRGFHTAGSVGCDGAPAGCERPSGSRSRAGTYEERSCLADADPGLEPRTQTGPTPGSPPDGMFTIFLPAGHLAMAHLRRLRRRSCRPPLSLELFQRLLRVSAPGTSRPPSRTDDLDVRFRRSTVAWWTGTASSGGSWPATPAHVQPFRGPGMNTGIQDACQPGLEACPCCTGGSVRTLLDTYEEDACRSPNGCLRDGKTSTRCRSPATPPVPARAHPDPGPRLGLRRRRSSVLFITTAPPRFRTRAAQCRGEARSA